MAIAVQSLGALASVDLGWTALPSVRGGSLLMYDQYAYDYATIYRTQPNVRTCVDFLARNIAQLGLHVFRRVDETDRQRLRDHPLVQIIEKPNPYTTRYRLIEALMSDLGIWFNAYWLKWQVGDSAMALVRVPPTTVMIAGGLIPTGYEINLGAQILKLRPDELVHFRGYNAENPIRGLSPLATLRRVLAEEHAMGDYREYYWRNAARMGGIIERPAGAPDWSVQARERFKAEFEALYAGATSSGKTAILEEGMAWKENTFNAQESEYLAGRKLTREECARAYHIPLPMVGILDHATFSNIREQHKNLYQDALGPWLAMIEQEIALQLLPEFEDVDGVYCEFNIQEKLQGSFEEQMQSLQAAVGRPWMTPDEARARLNMSALGGAAEELGLPLNIMIGASTPPPEEPPVPETRALTEKAAGSGEVDPRRPELRQRHEAKWREVLVRTFRRQRDAVLGKVPKGGSRPQTVGGVKQSIDDLWDAVRWNRELQADLYRLNIFTATDWAQYVTDQLGDVKLDQDVMLAWLENNARIMAEQINASTQDGIANALMDAEPRSLVQRLFELAISVRAVQEATTAVTRASSFGASEGARQGGLRSKTWRVNSTNPRPSHAGLDGVTVGIKELFPGVGMKWPGDPSGGAAEVANCTCSVSFGR